MNLTIREIISAVKGEFIGDETVLSSTVSGIVRDSREVFAGCLFAAIAGERSDGHDYIEVAREKGVTCALAERVPENCTCSIILVRDTIVALGELAEFYREKFDIPIIGITGSVGKTTAKEMVSAVLSERFNIHKTHGNLNNNLGVPLTLFGLTAEHEAAVIEMGISHFGEMAQLGQMVRPQMALFTSIGHAHLEFLHDLDGVLKAKTEMIPFMPEDGIIFINGDDETLKKLKCRQKLVSFGVSANCDVSAKNVRFTAENGIELTVLAPKRSFCINIHSFGLHLVYAALGAAAIGIHMGLTDDEIARGIAAYAPVGGRSAIEKTAKLTIINDCYNANPTSVRAALDSLAILSGRRVAILGDMMELGQEREKSLHEEIGEYAAKTGADLLITTGELSKATHIGALRAGLQNAVHFETKDELLTALPELIKSGDAVLVKASNSRRFDEIVEALKSL